MEKELVRYRCMTDDGCYLDIIEYQHFRTVDTDNGVRQYPGARRLVTDNEEPARYIDEMTFEIIETGELLRRQD